MLAYRLDTDPYFAGSSILVIDREAKESNDRTWCFWEEGPGEWDDILTHSWGSIRFAGDGYAADIPMGGYRYKMVRSAAFYKYLLSRLSPNVRFLTADVISWKDTGLEAEVTTNAGTYRAPKLYSSITSPEAKPRDGKFAYLHQHFTGWFVRTKTPAFDPSEATFMDFDIAQNGNTRFMYLLPLSENEALAEYTLFSENLLPYGEYEQGIRDYLGSRGINDYVITETEHGDIPMTCYPFWKHNSAHVMYIGSAGGWTKAATGYTFINIARNTQKLVEFLKSEDDLSGFRLNGRHRYFDLIFLDVLRKNNAIGSRIFASVFKNNDISTVLRFLDETSGWKEDLGVLFRTSPKKEFILSAWRNLPLIAGDLVKNR